MNASGEIAPETIERSDHLGQAIDAKGIKRPLAANHTVPKS
jgi:hypothetical protein